MPRLVAIYSICSLLIVIEGALAVLGAGRVYNGVGAVLALALMILESA